MPTFEEYRSLPMDARLGRLRGTPADLERLTEGKSEAELARRPAARSWCAKEILCHLRDVEELFQIRFHTILAIDEPSGTPSIPIAGRRIGSMSAMTPERHWRRFSVVGRRCSPCSSRCRWPTGSARAYIRSVGG
jgi:hypothetical protein